MKPAKVELLRLIRLTFSHKSSLLIFQGPIGNFDLPPRGPRLRVPPVVCIDANHVKDAVPLAHALLHADERDWPCRIESARLRVRLYPHLTITVSQRWSLHDKILPAMSAALPASLCTIASPSLYASASSSALASWRSAVAKPSVNQP